MHCNFFFISLKTKRCEKPMLPSDYRRIESELLLAQQQARHASYSTLQSESLNRKGWSAGYLGKVNFTNLLYD
jgi:hypothetical protein